MTDSGEEKTISTDGQLDMTDNVDYQMMDEDRRWGMTQWRMTDNRIRQTMENNIQWGMANNGEYQINVNDR